MNLRTEARKGLAEPHFAGNEKHGGDSEVDDQEERSPIIDNVEGPEIETATGRHLLGHLGGRLPKARASEDIHDGLRDADRSEDAALQVKPVQ
eukprot:CAMPEP_0194749182 /NCGR_PEP_ID=MMETSP0323_2-20130528/3377_1 /TAXON_ID=2866 ORGANISM="Crypthecodinium cohnii, Strain Seligo" /NCGR_SAMPLE_ID=MMETSP0323_2 /ASSEMBLY_ACC=CAM_ASM_000346 /LENGTH=92 /DNA_ID=CAMNT_0039664087 /DNA_START=635 /DNA_END=911 /DNA_ORIENTATION=+